MIYSSTHSEVGTLRSTEIILTLHHIEGAFTVSGAGNPLRSTRNEELDFIFSDFPMWFWRHVPHDCVTMGLHIDRARRNCKKVNGHHC